MRSLIFISFVFLVTGCDWKASPKPSFLVVAVEQLNSESFYCGQFDSEYDEGLGLLCSDGVRFTHAYAPSTLSQSTMASLLTGLYPKDTGIWHNGPQYLSEKIETVAEVAFSKGYRTSFFSGGPPIWRKSGLDQGFELFEDNLSVSLREPYRPVQKNFELFLNWYNDSSDGRPFFSVIFLPDLQYPQFVTVNDLGQERGRGFDGQLKEINESFAALAQRMKQQGIWENTYLILVGLNGKAATPRESELYPVNLHSENTQVVLIVKPARKARDATLDWTIDANVSLVDVGATLYDLLGSVENVMSLDNQLDVSTLKNALRKPQVDWNRERFIMSESAWASWRGVGETRTAIRQNNILYIRDTRPQIYNTLTDRFENQRIHPRDISLQSTQPDIKKFFELRGLNPWPGLPSTLVEKMKLAQGFSGGGLLLKEESRVRLAHLIRQRPWDKQLVGWMARSAIGSKDWALLERLGEEHLYPIWTYVARRNRGESLRPPPDSCWKWLDKTAPMNRGSNNCIDSEFVTFAEWTRASDSGQRSVAEDRFMRIHAYVELDELISSLNFENGLPWDVAVDLPGEPRLTELALTLPEYKGFRQAVEQRLKKF